MSPGIAARDLRLSYGGSVALDGLSFSLDGGKIYGLLGRNGSGKTSLLSLIAALRRPSGGALTVDGADPFENAAVMRRTCLIRDNLDANESDRVRAVLDVAAALRPGWEAGYAARLAERFRLDPTRKVSALSRGERSAVGIVLGLAARAPLTMFDESYLGLDAAARYAFYEELLADYGAHPRTVVLSTHLIDEVAPLFEEVLVIDRGRLVAHEETDTLRARGVTVTGPADAVDRFVVGLTVLDHQSLGPTKAATVYGRLDGASLAAARAAGLELGPVGLQDLFVHLTRQREADR